MSNIEFTFVDSERWWDKETNQSQVLNKMILFWNKIYFLKLNEAIKKLFLGYFFAIIKL